MVAVGRAEEDAGNRGKAGRGDRGRHGRGLRGALAAARRAQRLSDRARKSRRGRLVRQCRGVQRLVGDAGRVPRLASATCRAGSWTRSGRCRCAGAICRRSCPISRACCAPATPEKVRAQARALAPADRADRRRWCASWSARRRRRGSDPSARPSLCLPLGRERWRRIALAWALRRENGVEIDEFDADELRQLEPVLSREYVRGLLVRENGHTSNPHGLVDPPRRAVPARGRRDRAGAGARVPPRRQPADRDPHRCRRACRPTPRSSAPAPVRSRSPPRSATRCRSKPSAAIT